MKDVYYKALGHLIKKTRLEHNLSQESLCYGICGISYLSKIEAGRVQPNEEIIRQLLGVLNIYYDTDEAFIQKGKALLDRFFQAFFYKREEEKALEIALKKEEYRYKYSPLLMEYMLFEAYTLGEEDERGEKAYKELIHYKDYMTDDQLYKLYIYLGEYDISHQSNYEQGIQNLLYANKLKNTGYGMGLLVSAYYRQGAYHMVIHRGEEAFNTSITEGNIVVAINICECMAAANANLKNILLMIKYYERALHLSEGTQNDGLKADIHYNLGATYLTIQENNKALDELLRSLEMHKKCKRNHVQLYHKLAIVYHRLNKPGEAHYYLNLAKLELEENKNKHYALFKLMLRIIEIRLEDKHYLINLEYMTCLETVYAEIKKELHFGFKQFHGDDLIACYKANRRYKEALKVTEELYVFTNKS